MQYGFSIDPEEVLGVAPGASLREIREAYHAKAKKYHPDHEGDAWVFRVVSKAYELLSKERVAGRASDEFPTYDTAPARPTGMRAEDKATEHARPGIRDQVDDPRKLVDVELLVLRYAIEDPMDYFLKSAEERNLSCTVNIAWPGRSLQGRPVAPSEAEAIVKAIEKAVGPLPRKTRAVGSNFQADRGRFVGWLSYPTAVKANEALKTLHAALNARGLGMEQWSREMILPRDKP